MRLSENQNFNPRVFAPAIIGDCVVIKTNASEDALCYMAKVGAMANQDSLKVELAQSSLLYERVMLFGDTKVLVQNQNGFEFSALLCKVAGKNISTEVEIILQNFEPILESDRDINPRLQRFET